MAILQCPNSCNFSHPKTMSIVFPLNVPLHVCCFSLSLVQSPAILHPSLLFTRPPIKTYGAFTRSNSLPPPGVIGLDMSRTGSRITGHLCLQHEQLRRCCKPTDHCNKSCHPVELSEKLHFRRTLHVALQFLEN